MKYGRYFQHIHGKWSPYERLLSRYYPVPGCMPHRRLIGERRGEILFRHYADRPQASHGLYWRTHKEEYAALLKSNSHE